MSSNTFNSIKLISSLILNTNPEVTPLHSSAKASIWSSSRLFAIAGVLHAMLIIFLAACPPSANNGGNGSVTTYDYVCDHGTKAEGDATADNITRCKSCNNGFKLTNVHTCVRHTYVCEHGTPSGEDATTDNITKCAQCNGGFKLHNEQCVATKYTCNNGTPALGKPQGNVDEAKCASCSDGYTPQGTTDCVQAGRYFCTNGTPKSGNTGSTEAVHECATCFQGYTKRANNQCTIAVYTCTNGTPVVGGPATGTQDVENCQSCSGGYKKETDACVTTQYICTNGTVDASVTGNPSGNQDEERCQSCSDGYKKEGNLCNQAVFTCTNGTPSTGNPSMGNSDMEHCQSCSSGFIITPANTCNHAYICNNGTPTENTDATGDNVTQCDSCITGYFLSNQTCIFDPDDDNDGIFNSQDVDDDNDGLIEIHNLTMLHNMRHNLSGTSYNTSSGGSANVSGAPTTTNKASDYACSMAGLCGYELTQDLTFDQGADGTFTHSSGTYTLDSKDNNATYFPVTNGAGGWLPIGNNTNPFVAIFEGNGHTITGLAIKRNQNYVGMFGYINTGAHIRNVGLVANLADYSGSSPDFVYIGGLVGYQKDGYITASYATGSADGGAGSNDRTGGLVGHQNGESITASYATGSVNGGAGSNDYTGGLVGHQQGGSITASYATGSADGGNGDDDYTGGLVGRQDSASITASYATGTTNGGTGNNDYVGMLIGRSTGVLHSASYGFGTASNIGIVGDRGNNRPDGINTAEALTAANLTDCTGIENDKAYTSQTICEATTKAACTWGSNTCSGNVADINCSLFITQNTCTTTIKSTGTWNGNVWNAAASDTAGAWDFGTSSQTPALRYADYDGAGTDYDCSMFPAGKCGTLIPGQRD